MHHRVSRRFLAAAAACCAFLPDAHAVAVSGGAVVPGEWNSSFSRVKEYAEANHVPMVSVYVSPMGSCGKCEELEAALETGEFRSWIDAHKPVLVISDSATDGTKAASQPNAAFGTSFPFVGVYWPKEDGSSVTWKFSGVDKDMVLYREEVLPLIERVDAKGELTADECDMLIAALLADASYDSDTKRKRRDEAVAALERRDIGGLSSSVRRAITSSYVVQLPRAAGATLEAQLVAALDSAMGGYPYDGGLFLLPAGDTRNRLELEQGYVAGEVAVPLCRKSAAAEAENTLVCGEASVKVAWGAGESTKVVRIAVPPGAAAGDILPLALYDEKGGLRDESAIAVVEPQANSLRNPAWIGEAIAPGEWTMDFEGAIAQAALSDSYSGTLLFFTGALWCPHCQGLEDGVFNTDDFRNWAKENKLALVELDNPRRSNPVSPVDDYAIREASGAAPTLLRYDLGNNNYAGRKESGASYMSRKGIEAGDAETAGTAEWVLQRNRRLGYAWGEGTYCAPGSGRTGYPSVILLNKDGSVAGRLNRLEENKTASGGSAYWHDKDENMARLSDLLLLLGAGEDPANFISTTDKALVPGGKAYSATLQINDRTKYCRIDNAPTGLVSFAASAKPVGIPVELSLVRFADGVESTVATGVGSLSYGFSGETNLYLKVGVYKSAMAYGPGTSREVEVSSAITLLPAESAGEFQPDGRDFRIFAETGTVYRLAGLAAGPVASFEDLGPAPSGAEGRLYRALCTDAVQVEASGGSVIYQIWNPGGVSFADASISVFRHGPSVSCNVVRAGGTSGAVRLRVYIEGGDADPSRYEWGEDPVLEWGDGEGGGKSVEFSMRADGPFFPNQSLSLALEGLEGWEEVSTNRLELLLCDTDKPTMASTSYDIQLYTTFPVGDALVAAPVYNVQGGGSVKIAKVSGKLPSGVKLAYDEATRTISLVGTPKKSGKYEFAVQLTEKRGRETVSGPETSFAFDVAEPRAQNAFLSRKLKTSLPLFSAGAGGLELAGVVEFSQAANNKLAAKCTGPDGKSVSLKGSWEALEGGVATASLAKAGRILDAVLSPDGFVEVAYSDGGASYTSIPLFADSSAAAKSIAGYHTVAMPEDGSGARPGGASYLSLQASADGKVKWKGALANGQGVSGSAFVSLDAEGLGFLPVFKGGAKFLISAPLSLKPLSASGENERAVRLMDGAAGCWKEFSSKGEVVHGFRAWGSRYDASRGFADCCMLSYLPTELTLFFASDQYVPGERYGAIVAMPSGHVDVKDTKLSLVDKQSTLSLSSSQKTGVVKGSAKFDFANKAGVSVSFSGVVIPSWYDCGCEKPNPGDRFKIEESCGFVLGTAYFKEVEGGVQVKRSVPMTIGLP